jgi:endonuclease/exonuclease/phosphatase family metal-dependent hydrolase
MKRFALLLVFLFPCQAWPAPFKTMSYNILASYLSEGNMDWYYPEAPRRDRVHAILDQEAPDLIGFQEVTEDQLLDLIEDLPEHDYFAYSGQGKFFNATFYRRDRYVRLDRGVFWTGETPDTPLSSYYDRNVVWVTLHDRMSDQSFSMYNTHLQSIVRSGGRVPSSESIQEKIPEISGDLPVVLMGDFNSKTYELPFQIIMGQAGPTNVIFHDSCDSWCTGPSFPYSGSKIDYVLHTSDIQTMNANIVDTRVNGLLPSDHYPVTADLLFNTPSNSLSISESTRGALQSYVLQDLDSLGGFDGIGDAIQQSSWATNTLIGGNRDNYGDSLQRLILKFTLPDISEFSPALQQARLRFYVEDIVGNPANGLSLMHLGAVNETVQYISDYEHVYTGGGRDVLGPGDSAASYYEVDVTEFVMADMISDVVDPMASFRLQITNAAKPNSESYGYVIDTFEKPPVLVLAFVPEPHSWGLLLLGVLCVFCLRIPWYKKRLLINH